MFLVYNIIIVYLMVKYQLLVIILEKIVSDLAIQIDNLAKQYRLGLVGTGTLSHDLNRWWHLVRGKDDPYLKVGEVNNRESSAESDYVWALQAINLEVKKGEILGIIGRNGAGKSTLLKILSKVTGPTTGKININGRLASLLEVGTGFHPELTGRENVYLNGAILGMTKKEIDSKIEEIVDFAGVSKYVDTPVKRYSSGMMVRLGFAVAAHLEPDILVVDEVLAVGDAEFQEKALGKMRDVSNQDGRTILFVSHNLQAVAHLCSRCMLLDQGSITAEGEVNEVIRIYEESNVTRSVKTGASQIFEPDAGKDAQIFSISIGDKEGNQKLRFDLLEEIYVKINFIVRKPFGNLLASCQVRGPMGDVIIISTEVDNLYHNGTSDPLKKREPGEYQAEVKIPAPLLNKGSYLIIPYLLKPNRGWVDAVENIHISINDRSSFASAVHKRSRLGTLAIPLEWNVCSKEVSNTL